MPKERNKITIKPTFGIVKQPSKATSLQLTIVRNMVTNGIKVVIWKSSQLKKSMRL